MNKAWRLTNSYKISALTISGDSFFKALFIQLLSFNQQPVSDSSTSCTLIPIFFYRF